MKRAEPFVALACELEWRDLADEVDDIGRAAYLRDHAVIEIYKSHVPRAECRVPSRQSKSLGTRHSALFLEYSDSSTISSFVFISRPPRLNRRMCAQMFADRFSQRAGAEAVNDAHRLLSFE